MVPSSSNLGPRPTSPVEEDLQKLYNDVWAAFAEETPPPSSEGDLENIYNGYTDDSDGVTNPYSHPPTRDIRGSSPYLPPVDTSTSSTETPSKYSPTRRRLPPTPGVASSSITPTVMPMPEPDTQYSRQNPYDSSFYTSFPPSNIPSDPTPRPAGERTSTSSNGRRLPEAPAYGNDSKHSYEDGSRTPVSTSDYQSHGSTTSYSSSASFSGYSTGATSTNGDGYHRPAVPPKPSAYRTNAADLMSTYDQAGGSGYGYPQTHYSPASRSETHTTAKPPVPPPPSHPSTKLSSYDLDSGDQYASAPYSLSPVHMSPFGNVTDFSLKDPSSSSSQQHFFGAETQGSSKAHPYSQPQARPISQSEDDWNPDSYTYDDDDGQAFEGPEAGPGGVTRRPTDMLRSLADFDHNTVDMSETAQDEYWEDEEEEDETRFVNFSLLSHIAMQLRDKVPRGTHVKGSIPYPRAFTGKDIVSTIQTQIQRELCINHGVSTNDRRVALQVARSLQNQLFFYEVEWGSRALQDGVEDVYMFLDDAEGGSEAIMEREELPTGVITMFTRCYSPSCGEGIPCYSYTCPRQGNQILPPLPTQSEPPVVSKEEEWTKTIDAAVLMSLPQSEVTRQSIIHKLITREEQYLQDLDLVESVFIKPLRAADPPVIGHGLLEDLIDDIFGNILDLRECNRRLLEVLYVRQREEGPIILRIADIFLDAANEFRYAYPTYLVHHPTSEKRLKEELESNNAFRLFLEHCSRQQTARSGDSPKLDLKHFLNRPSEHLQKYPVLLEAVLHETAPENPDGEFLVEAIDAIRSLQSAAQLRTFQAAMGKGAPGKWEWHDLVSPEVREQFSKQEGKRQSIIFELIKGEMAYVKDLENMLNIYINPLRSAEPPIIARDRLDEFIDEVFHNYKDLYEHHKKLVDNFHEIQREQHPHIRSITAAMFDAALNFRDAYMEYIPNYPIAAYRIDDEMANNLAFKTFVDQCVRHPDAHRLDMKNFINRPIPRLLRYELLLKGIMEETPAGHEDHETIPQVIDVIKALGKETEPGVQSAKIKVEVWRYNANIVFKQGESTDMDLLDNSRQLIHSGKLLRQPESGLEWNGWSELHVLLFDNYLVMTKPKEKDGVTKYIVNRRPVPLDLLSLVNFTDPPTQRGTGILRNFAQSASASGPSPDSATDSRFVYPLTLHHNGRTGGPYILYAESAQTRTEWKKKLEEALGLRKIVQESNKVFEIEYLSRDTFIMPSIAVSAAGPAWNQDSQFTGKVTCSVPFNTPDGRAFVAIGCSEGVWIGFRHDPQSIRRVLHLKMVTQCAMLEEFGIFLVLADKALFAYHIEALVPSSPHAHTDKAPQKLSGTKDVHFFSVGTLQGRTLIVYMKRKGMDSIFRVLEPVNDKINERVRATAGIGSRLGFRSAKSEWFRVYRDFFLPSDSFDVVFLKARIAIFCAKGFEVMNLHDFGSITLPQREDPRHAQLIKRCEAARPLGMFRSTDEEFLLCYDEFGLYVDKHGDPCRSAGTIEWEGTAERVAFHSPYILLFDSRFIEIRHIQTGRLAQIIPGTEIRCTWDGRGGNSRMNNPAAPVPVDDVQEAQVHFVMNSTDSLSAGMRSKNIVQHVCELIPTVDLFPTGPESGSGSAAASISQFPPAQPTKGSDSYSTGPSHVSTNSYASSTASTAMGYGASATSSPYAYSPSIATSSYAPSLVTPPHAPVPALSNLNSIPPGSSGYFDRSGYPSLSPPRSPELRTAHSWRS